MNYIQAVMKIRQLENKPLEGKLLTNGYKFYNYRENNNFMSYIRTYEILFNRPNLLRIIKWLKIIK